MATAPSIQILKPGTFTDVRGTKVTFTRADLQEIADSYDAASDPAPLVVGHPGLDAPAYGWVGRVELGADDVLRAFPSEIAPAFGEAVQAGQYRKVSPQLYPPGNPANPKAGRWYLQHVGFLGAAPPAIKGLGTVSFSQVDDTVAITFEQEPPVADTPTDTVSLSQHNERVSTLEQQIADLTETARLRDEQQAAAALQAAHGQNVAFAEGLIAAGTLAPAGKDRVVALMDQLAPLAVVSFGEGDAAVEQAPLAAFRSLFDTAQPVIALGEHAPADKTVQTPTVIVSFAAPPGYTVAPDQAALHARAKAIQADTPGLTFWDAFERARHEPAA